jgi:hypothetical protein
MMELEQASGEFEATDPTRAAEHQYRLSLAFATQLDGLRLISLGRADVAQAVTIRAEQIAFRGLGPEPLPRDAAIADLELLGARVSAMEFERLAFRRLRRCSTRSLGASAPGGSLDVLCAPKGEQARQNLRRYNERTLSPMTAFDGNSAPHCSQVLVWIERWTGFLGARSGRCGRHTRHRFRPRRSSRMPFERTTCANEEPHSSQTSMRRTLVLSSESRQYHRRE